MKDSGGSKHGGGDIGIGNEQIVAMTNRERGYTDFEGGEDGRQ